MTDIDNSGDLVVAAGYVTVKTKVGAGMAYVDVPAGEVLPADVSDEDRRRLLDSGAVRRRNADGSDGPAGVDGAVAPRPVPGEVEPNEIDPDVIPGGSSEQVMAWIGDDLARARVARHEEKAKGDKARAGLIEAIEAKMATLEAEPPAVPEHLDGSAPAPAPAGGGVAVPSLDPDAGEGKPADDAGAVDGAAKRGRRRP